MDFDVIIVGGGLAGASVAVALRASPLRLAIVEPNEPVHVVGWDSRVYAVSPANVEFLRAIGGWQHLDISRTAPVRTMSIRGDAGGSLEFSAYESGLPELARIVESGRLHRELWETIRRQHNVTMITGVTPQRLSFEHSTAGMEFSDGRRADARLVVGADGVNSWVRQRAGIEARTVSYGQIGVVANFRIEREHHATAYQWFRADGILALLPLPGKLVSMVWSTGADHARELLAMDGEALSRRVADAADGLLGRFETETPPAGFPLRFLRVDTTVRPRVALVGDAAHAIHPLSGHGINLGFQDAKALADALKDLPPWRDPGEMPVLRTYARARAEEPFLMQYTTHGLNQLFASANPVLSLLRNVGMSLTGHVPGLRDVLVRYAVSGRF